MTRQLLASPLSTQLSRRTAVRGLGAIVGAGTVAAAGARAAAAQTATPTASQSALNVAYRPGDDPATQLDLYGFDPAHPRPAVLVIHGGALVGGNRADLYGVAQAIARAGYVAVNLNYRLYDPDTNANPWPTQLDDVQRVVRWLRANATRYGVDPKRIGALGHSSGGQLAAFLGTRDTRDNRAPALASFSSRVGGVVDLAGPVDATIPTYVADINTVFGQLLGGTMVTPPTPAAVRDFSPIAFVDAKSAPFLILHGDADEIVPTVIPERMTDALHAAGVEVVSGEFAGLTHGDLLAWNVIGPWVVAFLARQLAPGS